MGARLTNKGEKMVIAKQQSECAECGQIMVIENHLDIDVSVSWACPNATDQLSIMIKPLSSESKNDEKFLSIKEVCSRLAMSKSAVYREIQAGRLTATKRVPEASMKITESALVNFMESLEPVNFKAMQNK